MKITPSLQQKLEDIFKALHYSVRFEKGNFKSGYCLLEDKNIVVINKFFSLEGKVNTMFEIIRIIQIDESLLSEEQIKLCQKLKQTVLELWNWLYSAPAPLKGYPLSGVIVKFAFLQIQKTKDLEPQL